MMQVVDFNISKIIVEERQKRPENNIESLVASIQDVGLLHPIVVGTDGRLKVGYRRLTAYRTMGRSTIPAHVTDSLEDVYAALKAERDENTQREEMPPTLIVERARELEEEERRLAADRMNEGKNQYTEPCGKFPQGSDTGTTRDRVGAAFGVSGKTYEKAKSIVEAADNDPETFGDLPALMDTKSVDAANKELRKRHREQERKELADKALSIDPNDRYNVVVADIRTHQTTKQYDFIITDPPYLKEYLPLYGVLCERARQWLKPQGLLVMMCGQSYLNQIYKMADEHLTYYWTGAYLTPGQPTPLRQRQVNTTWKPILIYGLTSDYKGKIFGDVFKSDANDKSLHEWGQSVSGMHSLINQLCVPGQSIFDPFCGAGTTGVAALMNGCLFDGIDMIGQNVNISIGRLGEVAR